MCACRRDDGHLPSRFACSLTWTLLCTSSYNMYIHTVWGLSVVFFIVSARVCVCMLPSHSLDVWICLWSYMRDTEQGIYRWMCAMCWWIQKYTHTRNSCSFRARRATYMPLSWSPRGWANMRHANIHKHMHRWEVPGTMRWVFDKHRVDTYSYTHNTYPHKTHADIRFACDVLFKPTYTHIFACIHKQQTPALSSCV